MPLSTITGTVVLTLSLPLPLSPSLSLSVCVSQPPTGKWTTLRPLLGLLRQTTLVADGTHGVGVTLFLRHWCLSLSPPTQPQRRGHLISLVFHCSDSSRRNPISLSLPPSLSLCLCGTRSIQRAETTCKDRPTQPQQECVSAIAQCHSIAVFFKRSLLFIPGSYSIAVCLRLFILSGEPVTTADWRIVCRERN